MADAKKYSTRKNSTKSQTIALRQVRNAKRGGNAVLTRSGHVKAVNAR